MHQKKKRAISNANCWVFQVLFSYPLVHCENTVYSGIKHPVTPSLAPFSLHTLESQWKGYLFLNEVKKFKAHDIFVLTVTQGSIRMPVRCSFWLIVNTCKPLLSASLSLLAPTVNNHAPTCPRTKLTLGVWKSRVLPLQRWYRRALPFWPHFIGKPDLFRGVSCKGLLVVHTLLAFFFFSCMSQGTDKSR